MKWIMRVIPSRNGVCCAIAEKMKFAKFFAIVLIGLTYSVVKADIGCENVSLT